MSRELMRSLALAIIGLVAGLGLVFALYGGGNLMRRLQAPGADGPVAERATPPQAPSTDGVPNAPGADMAGVDRAGQPKTGPDANAGGAQVGIGQGQLPPGKPSVDAKADPPAQAAPNATPTPAETGAPSEPRDTASPSGSAPSFDLVRIEPNGETVVAGRGTPNTVVEMLVDGKPVARALADPNGQFALVPPSLPTGDSDIVLRSTGADGRETRSKQSVAVSIAPRRDTKPLVAMSSPDTPTVVLSQPEASEAGKVASREGPAGNGQPTPGAIADRTKPKTDARSQAAVLPDARAKGADKGGDKAGGRAAEADKPVPPLRIVSVDAQDGGRLYVTGEATPGATVRLYLNETLIAPASVGSDGKVTFAIGRGVKPGAYKVRIDHVDSVSGKVRTRAEVPFTVPDLPMKVAGRELAAPPPTAQGEPALRATEDAGGSATPSTPVSPMVRLPIVIPPSIEVPPAPGSSASNADRSPSVEPGRVDDRASGPVPRDSALDRAGAAPAADKRDALPSPALKAAEALVPPASQNRPLGLMAPPQVTGRNDAAIAAPTTPRPGSSVASADKPGTVFVPEINTAKIIRGDSLWQISRRTYGKGFRYTEIYDANQEQIRDPDLIYPGQIFVLPGGDTGKRG